jgi:hypothetical protein
MAVSISATGLTNQLKTDVADALIATQGPFPEGMTKAQIVSLCTLRFWKAVVKGWKRSGHETSISAENAAVETAYGDEVI